MMATAAVAQSTSAQSSSHSTQTASAKSEWQASKLIGTNVYNAQNEKIGDIKELLLDQSGKINEVAVSVGGFLGMGEHDIKVDMSKLKFVNEAVRTSSTTSTTTTGEATRPANTSTTTTRSTEKQWYPDHAVLSGATKEQLKSMTQFKYN